MNFKIVVECENLHDSEGIRKSIQRSSYFNGKNNTGGASITSSYYCEKCAKWYNTVLVCRHFSHFLEVRA